MLQYLLVFVGGGVGAMGRHARIGLLAPWGQNGFPWPTLGVNVLGALAMGLLTEGLALRLNLSYEGRLLLVTGVLGGFTTFSAFSLEAVLLYTRGAYGQLALYVGLSVVGTMAALMLGMYLMRNV